MLERVGIADVADFMVGTLPTGTARLVELARALALDPKVLLLDEASSGLNEEETEEMAALLQRLAGDGLGILLVEHDMSFVMGTCQYIYVLDFGAIIAEGTPAEVQADPKVQAAYLGTLAGPHRGGPGMTAILELRNIRGGYGTIDVLHGVNLTRRARPGARPARSQRRREDHDARRCAAARSCRPAASSLLSGREVQGASSDALARAGVCLVPEGRGIFPNLTVTENLRMFTHAGTPFSEVQDRAFTQFPRLKERRKQVAGTHVGRRAADARHVPGPRHQPGAAAARRAVDGPRAR